MFHSLNGWRRAANVTAGESRDLTDGVEHTLGFGPTAGNKTVAENLMLSGNKAGSSQKRTTTPISTLYYRRFTPGAMSG